MGVEQLIAWLQRGMAWHIPLISSEVASPWALLSSVRCCLLISLPVVVLFASLIPICLPNQLTHWSNYTKDWIFKVRKNPAGGFWILMGLGATMGGYWVVVFVFHICDVLKQTLWLFTTDITTEDGRPTMDHCGARLSMAPHSKVGKCFRVLKIHHCCK